MTESRATSEPDGVLQLDRMTWTEVREAIEMGLPLILPTGSIEQHGPHLPLGTDAFIPHELATRAAAERRAIVAPPLVYAAYSRPRSGGGRSFPGSTGMPASVVQAAVHHVTSDLVRQGFRKVMVLNGHWENSDALYEAIQQTSESQSDRHKLLLVNWWDQLGREDLQEIFDDRFPGWETEHAALTETSLLEALRPDLVRVDRKTDGGAERLLSYDIFPPPPEVIPREGIGWSAKDAGPELGAKLVGLLVRRIVDIIDREFADA